MDRRIGSVAGITTLQVMAKEKSWEKISEGGRHFQNRMKELANSFKLPLVVNGIEALTTFISILDGLAYKLSLVRKCLKKDTYSVHFFIQPFIIKRMF